MPQTSSDHIDEEFLRWREERLRRRRLILVIAPVFLGLIIGEVARFFVQSASQEMIISLIRYSCYGVSGFGVLMIYLQTGFKTTVASEAYSTRDSEFDSLRERLEATRFETERLKLMVSQVVEAKEQFTRAATSIEQLTDDQRAELAMTVKQRIETDAASEAFKALREQMLQSITRDGRLEQHSSLFKATIARLDREIAALGWRGNLNLVIGIFISVSGLSVLGYVVFHAQLTNTTPEALAVYYLPRISLVLFIEVFAYFFLKLYKASLAEIKYFQNEITNVEAKLAALMEATREGSDSVRADVIKVLSNTERNFILRKDESTVDIERAKLEKDGMSDLGDKILQAFRIRDK